MTINEQEYQELIIKKKDSEELVALITDDDIILAKDLALEAIPSD